MPDGLIDCHIVGDYVIIDQKLELVTNAVSLIHQNGGLQNNKQESFTIKRIHLRDDAIPVLTRLSSTSSSLLSSSLSARSLSRMRPYPRITKYFSMAWTRASGSILTVPPFHCLTVLQDGCRCKLHLSWCVLKKRKAEVPDRK